MKKLLVYILFLFCSTVSGYSQEVDTVTFIYKWEHQFEFAGFYAAIEKGFFAEENLYVKEEQIISVDKVKETLINKPGTYSTNNTNILLDRDQGVPFVIVTPIFQHSPSAFFVRKNSGINHPIDLIGKKIVVARKIFSDLHVMLASEGIDPESLTIISQWKEQSFIEGETDAITHYTISLNRMPYPDSIRVIRPIKYGVDFYGECVYTTEEEIIKHPERAKAFRKAVIKGWKYALDNPEEVVDLIIEKYQTKLNREQLLDQAIELNTLMIPNIIEVGSNSPTRWNSIINQLKNNELISSGFEQHGLFMDDYTKEDLGDVKKVLFWSGFILMLVFIIIFIQSYFNDILKKRVKSQTKELSDQNYTLNKINQELDNLVYKVSHDLKSPLKSTRGLISIYWSDPEKNTDELINMIDSSMLRMDQYIKDILSYSRNSRIEVEISEIDLNKLITETVEILMPDKNNVRMEVDIEQSKSCFGDEVRLKIILNNLISNSIRYSDHEKDDPHILVKAYTEDDKFKLTIKDNGLGIPKDERKNVFKMFYRANQNEDGSGLGLYIVKESVDKMGGSIELNSLEGKFTEIIITLPNTLPTPSN